MTDKIRLGISFAFLAAGFFTILAIAGLPPALIFAMLWFEKVTLGLSQGVLVELGIEFATVPMVFIGVLYGPWTAFLVGFFGLPLLDSVRWIISPPKYSGGWPPVIPGPDSFVDGLTGAVAGFLYGFLPFSWASPIAIITKNIIAPIKDTLTYGNPPRPTIIVNIGVNIFLAGFLSFVLNL